VQNFAFLINTYGHIPNGNRTYYLSRSQPPFFSLMLELLASVKGNEVYGTYLPALEQEYRYWMDETATTQHVVKMPDGSVLNRYWDQLDIPRQESYIEDVKTAGRFYPETAKNIYRNLRSAAESGWDFSSRWLKDGKTLSTIETTSIIPVDLNCLLYHMELTLSRMHLLQQHESISMQYSEAARKRKQAINAYCWSAKQGWYVDYNIVTKRQSGALTLAGMFPFFLQLSDGAKFAKAKPLLVNRFLKAGGVQTTMVHTGQQWDAPNGWAPLQWVTVMGLENYGAGQLAKKIAQRWVMLNQRVFKSTGKLMEKYDVVHVNRKAGGGEYPSQDGFGWTNGVLLALISKYGFTTFAPKPSHQTTLQPIK
jgi:alpha,alpha-trehalase